jgi:delta(3,5)-delta(2,4)-dienoyl-CoA isomerase
MMADLSIYSHLTTLAVSSPAPHIIEVRLNRPDKINALNVPMWDEILEAFNTIKVDPSVRVVLLTGEGPRGFTSGLDFSAMASNFVKSDDPKAVVDVAYEGLKILKGGKNWQDSFSSLEHCGKVVIACVHGLCLGAGVELISSADIRICTQDVHFKLLEIDIGMAADCGGLQRFPKLIGNQSLVRELAFSGRDLLAPEAMSAGFVSRVCATRGEMREYGLGLAKAIAAKSPVALLSAKKILNYTRDHGVDEALEYSLVWNAAALQGRDLQRAVIARMRKQAAEFPDIPKACL